jgi:Cft2 family RNA processing exonuclease
MFEGARVWLAAQISEQGLYRDVPFWVDLVMAKAYSEYFRSMAEGMLSADFGRGTTPAEQLKKFLGIDQLRKSGQSRVKRLTH